MINIILCNKTHDDDDDDDGDDDDDEKSRISIPRRISINRIAALPWTNFSTSSYLSMVSIRPHHVHYHDIWFSADIEAVVTSGQGACLAQAVARGIRIIQIQVRLKFGIVFTNPPLDLRPFLYEGYVN